MQTKSSTFKRYPYAGFSKNLIEYFYIIGYSKDKINNYSQKNNIIGEPEILSVVNNSNQVKVVESEIIMKQIFTSCPSIIDLNTENSNQTKPKKSTVMFMLNPDDYNQPIKNPSCCVGLIFYEPQKVNNKFYFPKAFCIVSQFPYFSFYNELNKNILEMFEKSMDIPIEIIIYNIVNFIPSPINFDLELNIFPQKYIKYVENGENNISNKERNSSNMKKNSKENIIVSNNNDNSNNTIKGRTNSSFSKNSTNSNNNNETSNHYNCLNSVYKLKQLTGYPQMDIDIIKIFNILPVENIIEIFILLLLEIDIIFFSKNLEILNPVMYILSKLTFPCDDTMYQWNIVSVSKSEFSTDNIFAGKPGTVMLGVNCTYESTIETIKVRGNNIVVDLDNKKIEFITTSQEEFDQMNNFRKFIKQCIFPQTNYYLYFNQNSNNNLNFFYKDSLNKMYNEINSLINKKPPNTHTQQNSFNNSYGSQYLNNNVINDRNNSVLNKDININNQSYNTNLNNTNDLNQFDFFDYKDVERTYKINKQIQEIFYNFMIKILGVFYKFFRLKSISEKNVDVDEDEKNSFFIKCSDKTNDKEFFDERYDFLNEHEKYFFNNFLITKRNDKFFLGYISKNEANKMHRIGYLFSEEYLYIQKSSSFELDHSLSLGKHINI